MNKYQEAFNNFKTLKYIPNAAGLTMNLALLEKDIYTFHELVDKETPKKPLVNKYKNSEHYFCPSCKRHRFGILDYGEYKNEWRKNSELTPYCPKCGQKLDWSDEDE